MRKTLGLLAAGILLSGLSVLAQSANPAPQGRGRGGAPRAYGDSNRDGICEVTGQPVGQGRRGARAGGRRGARGCGQCCRCGMGANAGAQTPTPAPAPAPGPAANPAK